MAFVYITEYKGLAREDFAGPTGVVQTPVEPPLAEQKIAIASGSTASDYLHKETRVVRVHSDAICHVTVAEDPTATTGNRRFAANTTEYIGIPPTGKWKIANITGT